MYFIKEINLNSHWEKKSPLKSIEFNFPIYEDSDETVFMCKEKAALRRLRRLKNACGNKNGLTPKANAFGFLLRKKKTRR